MQARLGPILDRVYPDRGEGLWEQNPEIALAAGVLYFTILGIFELVIAGSRGERLAATASLDSTDPFKKVFKGRED